jgi:hypothetical protein
VSFPFHPPLPHADFLGVLTFGSIYSLLAFNVGLLAIQLTLRGREEAFNSERMA